MRFRLIHILITDKNILAIENSIKLSSKSFARSLQPRYSTYEHTLCVALMPRVDDREAGGKLEYIRLRPEHKHAKLHHLLLKHTFLLQKHGCQLRNLSLTNGRSCTCHPCSWGSNVTSKRGRVTDIHVSKECVIETEVVKLTSMFLEQESVLQKKVV